MELVGVQLNVSLIAIIICLIFFIAFSIKKEPHRIEKAKKNRTPQKPTFNTSEIKPRNGLPLSFLDPHQPSNTIKRFN